MCITITRDVGAPRSSFRTRRRPRAFASPRAQLCAIRTAVCARFPTTSGGSPPSPLALALALALARLVTSSRSNFVIERARCTHAETALGSSEAAFARAGLAALARGLFSSHAPSGVLRLEGVLIGGGGGHLRVRETLGGGGRGGGRRRRLGLRGEGRLGLGLGDVDRGSAGRSAASGFDASPSFPSVEAGASGTSGAEVGGDVVPSVTTARGASGASEGAGWSRQRGRGRGRKPRAPALGFEKGKESEVRASATRCAEKVAGGRRKSARACQSRATRRRERSRGRVASGDASASPARGGWESAGSRRETRENAYRVRVLRGWLGGDLRLDGGGEGSVDDVGGGHVCQEGWEWGWRVRRRRRVQVAVQSGPRKPPSPLRGSNPPKGV